MKKVLWILAIGFGSGLSPFASGTAGALLAFIIFFIISFSKFYLFIFFGLFIFFLIFSIPASNVGIQKTNNKDPKQVVIDEIVGSFFSICFINLYPIILVNKIKILIIGFLLFRLFDVWKPYPIRKLEELKDGLGVVADDALAGIFANIILLILIKFLL